MEQDGPFSSRFGVEESFGVEGGLREGFWVENVNEDNDDEEDDNEFEEEDGSGDEKAPIVGTNFVPT